MGEGSAVMAVAVQIESLRQSALRLREMADTWDARGHLLAADVARREAQLDEAAVRRLSAARARG
jgi:hypothetical protein